MKDSGYDNITGKPLDKTYLEVNLPRFLKQDIDALIKGEQEHSDLLDCLWCEVYGSINSAYHGNEINKEQADYLREKYLGIVKEPSHVLEKI